MLIACRGQFLPKINWMFQSSRFSPSKFKFQLFLLLLEKKLDEDIVMQVFFIDYFLLLLMTCSLCRGETSARLFVCQVLDECETTLVFFVYN